MAGPRPAGVIGLPWPMRGTEVRSRFGAPDGESAVSVTYKVENEVGSDSVVFTFDGDRVSAVEWQYFIE